MQMNISIPENTGVAIVAPSGYAPDEAALARSIACLEQSGCVVHCYYDPERKMQRFAASENERAAQLHAAADDPDAQIVMALRGGYGMSRLMNMLDFESLAKSGKLFVGHSDFTALQMGMLAACGGCSFAGPMMCDDFTREPVSEFTMEHFWRCVTAKSGHTVTAEATPSNPVIDVTGTLWGGNLAMLSHLAGTSFLPQIEGGILFLEDINEHPYRIERMLLQLLHAGVLARQEAILLGDFSGYKVNDYDNGYDLDAVVQYLRSRLAVPVLSGLAFGHIRDKVTLAVGAKAQLASERNAWKLSMSEYPVLV